MTTCIRNHLSSVTTITFDCYGTLIDWRAGIESSMRQVFGSVIIHRMHEIYALYLEAEKKVESESDPTFVPSSVSLTPALL